MAKTPDISSMKKPKRNLARWPKHWLARVAYVMVVIVLVTTVVASVAFTPVGGILSGAIVALLLGIIYVSLLFGVFLVDALFASHKAARR